MSVSCENEKNGKSLQWKLKLCTLTIIKIDFQWLGCYLPSARTLFVAVGCHFESSAGSSSSSAPYLWRFSAAPAGVGANKGEILKAVSLSWLSAMPPQTKTLRSDYSLLADVFWIPLGFNTLPWGFCPPWSVALLSICILEFKCDTWNTHVCLFHMSEIHECIVWEG